MTQHSTWDRRATAPQLQAQGFCKQEVWGPQGPPPTPAWRSFVTRSGAQYVYQTCGRASRAAALQESAHASSGFLREVFAKCSSHNVIQ